MFRIKKLDCWLRGVKFKLITDNKILTFLINKRIDELKPAIARKILTLYTKTRKKFDMWMHYQDIYSTQILRKILIEPVINVIQGKQKHKSGLIDISEMDLGQLTLQKVRQLQKFDTFYNGMYRFLQYGHLPKDKLLWAKP